MLDERNGSARSTVDAREDVRRYIDSRIESILGTLEVVIDLKREYPIACDGCGQKIGVRFPDVRAVTDLLRLLFDQGYGRPGVEQAEERESDLSILQAYPPEVRQKVMADLRAKLDAAQAAAVTVEGVQHAPRHA